MKQGRRILLSAVIIFIGFLCCSFIFRGYLLELAFKKAQTHIHDRYKTALTVSSVRFSDLNTIVLKNLTLQPDGADTFLRVSEAEVKVSLANLFRAKIVLDQIRVNGAFFTIYNEDGRNNISFLRSAGHDDSSVSVSKISGYRERASNWEAKLFRVLNTAFEVRDIQIHYQDSTATEFVYVPSFTYDLHTLSGMVINQKIADTISIDGVVVKKKEHYQCTVRNLGNDNACLPFLDREHGLQCRFRSVTADIKFDNNSDACKISTDASLENFHINHWRLAKEDVIFQQARFQGDFIFTDDAIEMDSSSTVTLGNAKCQLFARYDLKPDTTFSLALHMPELSADSFFQALPAGMFNTLKGISCSGTLAYDLTFAIHTNNPDSLLFYSAMKQKNLHVQHFGADNYTRINSSFTYEAYDKDRFVRRLIIGPENPYFTPLDHMSKYLPQAVLQAEDPGFMQHRGFYLDAFRESIAKNFKERRFARGGSTISMQLVKNVFLSRDKTVSRKAEEALIVFLIENLGLVSKERMLEVYLNVIEWGPNVYGIGEASRFYFNKKPSELTLQESLFLASIIPRPRSFQYQFDKEGQLRTSMGDYFKILTTRMVWRGVLEPADTIGLAPKVTLKGSALHVVMPKDSVTEESDIAE
jgi:hypothetical protein